MTSFSERYGHQRPDAEITVRNDAPEGLREAVVTIAYGAGLQPSDVRSIVCQVLLRTADRNNWSNFPNIDGEVRDHLRDCLWFEVYDVVEGIAGYLQRHPRQTSDHKQASAVFDEQLNRFFRREGIGWQLVQGRLEMRGTEAFELAVRQGRDELWAAGKATAATELHEAIQDLSRRPDPEITGAVQHAVAALECIAREKTGGKETLGALIQRNRSLFPAPLDKAVEQVYGFASNQGRHLFEGRRPEFEEAELVVGLSGVLCRYLSRRT
ncbi:MAG: hypothetical protein AMXMBFR59_31280 [Rhodanobacteraceae bacterium]